MISANVQKLIDRFKSIKEIEEKLNNQPEAVTIHTDEVARKVAAFYEKIRKIVDWREEHLMRRVAIKRILKRRNFLSRSDDAEDFVVELIRGGLFPNDRISRTKIKDVKKILGKYSFILQAAEFFIKEKKHLFWTEVLDIASCEIEETLDEVGHRKMNAMVEFVEGFIGPQIIIGKRAIKECPLIQEEKEKFLYIAIQQALLNLDEQLIFYNLLKRKNPDWQEKKGEEQTAKTLLKEVIDVINEYELINAHPLFNKFYGLCERHDTPFLIIGDIVNAAPEKALMIIGNEDTLKSNIRKSYEQRLEKLKGKTRRSAVYSTISVFLGNVLSLYVIEVPFSIYVMGFLNVWAKVLTVVVPTLLMFILVATIRPPSANNYRLVIEKTKKIVAGEQYIYEVDIYPKKKLLFNLLTLFVYFISICICIALYGYFLYYFSFPPLSSFLFVAFTTLILFAGIKIRQRARELHIELPKEGFFSLVRDLFSLPLVHFGKWLSNYWRKFNIVSITFNFLVELPFVTFINFIESWRYFVKEKKEDIH